MWYRAAARDCGETVYQVLSDDFSVAISNYVISKGVGEVTTLSGCGNTLL